MRFLISLTGALLLVIGNGGCASSSTDRVQASGPIATCYVCQHNNDLACVNVRVKDSTPRTEFHGQTYCFCSQDCCAAFAKNPEKYLPKIDKKHVSAPK